MPDSPAPAGNPIPARNKRSAENRLIAAYVSAAEIFLNVAAGDAEISQLLAASGYDATDYAEGRALATTIRTTLTDRAGGKGNQALKTGEFNEALGTARGAYASFRQIARASFPDPADRLALSLTGGVPEDSGRFITLALASYAAAGKGPQATKLAKRGYTPEKLGPLSIALNNLTGDAGEQDQAQGDALEDTAGARCRLRRPPPLHAGTQGRRQRSPPRQTRPALQAGPLSSPPANRPRRAGLPPRMPARPFFNSYQTGWLTGKRVCKSFTSAHHFHSPSTINGA